MMIDRRQMLIAAAGTGIAATGPSLAAEPEAIIELWPNDAPGLPGIAPVEVIEDRSADPAVRDRSIRGVLRPRLLVFRPAVPNGSAALVIPGGGFSRLVFDKEGAEVAMWLTARGWTAFVLLHRLPGDGWAAGPDVALFDAQRAMRLIRARAATYRIDPAKVAAMGFSAGGHVCGDLATRFDTVTYTPVDAADRLSARPIVAAPIYAVQSMTLPVAHAGSRALLIGKDAGAALERRHSPALNVSPTTPPMFLVHAEDDASVVPDNSLQTRAALKAAGVPVELHLFATGGHGFALRQPAAKPVARWPELFATWAATHGLG